MEYFHFKKSDELRQYLLQLPFEGDREYLPYEKFNRKSKKKLEKITWEQEYEEKKVLVIVDFTYESGIMQDISLDMICVWGYTFWEGYQR